MRHDSAGLRHGGRPRVASVGSVPDGFALLVVVIDSDDDPIRLVEKDHLLSSAAITARIRNATW